ncbi:hypothetical protein [Kitasatospora paranensis]|uniref:DUF4034 domain-containing protein n=1 Tax=Kitasatospora paranensis TaxID=258053 RepID=A0ABW2G7R3_9ACTN
MPPAASLPAGPVYDLVVAFPDLAHLRAAARRRDWDTVSTTLTGLDDGDDLVIAARTVAGTTGVTVMLDEALAAAGDGPDGVLPRSLLAYHHILTGWDIRSGYTAEHVSRSQFDRFHDHLRQAERLLIEAVALDPSHALGWHLRLMTARGLGLGQSEARRRYDRLATHRPHHFSAKSQLLQQLCPKWGGSWEAAHAFADECRRGAEPGGLGALITVEAHVEHWATLGGAEQHTYWWREGVRESLSEAAESSVLHPDFERNLCWLTAHTDLAAAFSFSGQPELAAPHFEALGRFAAEYPWNSISGQPDALWRRHRDAALATAARKA